MGSCSAPAPPPAPATAPPALATAPQAPATPPPARDTGGWVVNAGRPYQARPGTGCTRTQRPPAWLPAAPLNLSFLFLPPVCPRAAPPPLATPPPAPATRQPRQATPPHPPATAPPALATALHREWRCLVACRRALTGLGAPCAAGAAGRQSLIAFPAAQLLLFAGLHIAQHREFQVCLGCRECLVGCMCMPVVIAFAPAAAHMSACVSDLPLLHPLPLQACLLSNLVRGCLDAWRRAGLPSCVLRNALPTCHYQHATHCNVLPLPQPCPLCSFPCAGLPTRRRRRPTAPPPPLTGEGRRARCSATCPECLALACSSALHPHPALTPPTPRCTPIVAARRRRPTRAYCWHPHCIDVSVC